MYYEKITEKSLERMIEGLCCDYGRRNAEIKKGEMPRRVLNEYKFLNAKILEGVLEIIGPSDAEALIEDIGIKRGYANSPVSRFAEVRYKQLKAKAKLNIAKKLFLI